MEKKSQDGEEVVNESNEEVRRRKGRGSTLSEFLVNQPPFEAGCANLSR